MTKNVLMVASGLKNLGGHNFSYTRAVEAALERKGFTTTVFAHKHLSGELVKETGYHPVFSFGAYDFPPGLGKLKDLRYLYAQSLVYSQELEQAFKQLIKDEPALVFCHTVADFELIGWHRFLAQYPFKGPLLILLRTTVGLKSGGWFKRHVHPYWRIKPHYLNALHNRLQGRFVLVTDSEPLTEDYAAVFRHRNLTLPIPINEYVLNVEAQPLAANGVCARYGLTSQGKLRIGYAGEARPTKGFPLLPGLVRQILAETRLPIEFVFQCPSSAVGIDKKHLPEGVAELLELERKAQGQLTLIQEKLSDADYAELLRAFDIILIPYQAVEYAEATSGILAEAMALAKPVVVPAGTWMARELRKSGGGLEFQRTDSNDLAAKVKDLIENFDGYAAKARAFSAQWRAFHNSHTLADMLIRELHQGPITAANSYNVTTRNILESNE